MNRRFTRPDIERQADFIYDETSCTSGEVRSKYFKKGQQVCVICRLQVRNREDEQCQKRYVTEVVAEEAYVGDSKRDEADTTSFENTFGNNVASSSTEFKVISSDDLPF